MGKKLAAVTDFIFLFSKITVDGDCSHESNRLLLIGRKPMTHLDSILHSRDITLLLKVHIFKAMVFLVAMYRYKSWTIKKTKCQIIDAFKFWSWRRSSRVFWIAKRSNQSILNEINSAYSLEGLVLKLKLKPQYFGYMMQRADSLEKTLILGKVEGRMRSRWQRMR